MQWASYWLALFVSDMAKAEHLTDFEARLLNRLQADFPLVARPFACLAEELGATEGAVVAAVQQFLAGGLVREISPVFEARALGYVSTLAAMQVPPERVAEVAEIINGYPEVTHNYLRDYALNMWFAVIAAGEAEKARVLREIEAKAACGEVHDLPALRLFKVRAVFEVGPHPPAPSPRVERGGTAEADGRPCRGAIHRAHGATASLGSGRDESRPYTTAAHVAEHDWPVIEALQDGIAAVERPFAALAEKAGVGEEEFLQRTQALVESGIIRRFGARVRHHRAGLEGNLMVAWRVPAERVEAVGALFAQSPAVTHCYVRPDFAGFPYGLYTMVHARDEAKAAQQVAAMAEDAGVGEYAVLRTVKELKKTTPRYRRPR